MAHLLGYGMLSIKAMCYLYANSIDMSNRSLAQRICRYLATIRVFSVCSLFIQLINAFCLTLFVIGGVVITTDFLKLHNLEGPSKTKTLSTVTAIYDVGCFLGAICAFTLGERLGRKRSILAGTTIMALGTVLQASSFSLPQIFVGRIVSG